MIWLVVFYFDFSFHFHSHLLGDTPFFSVFTPTQIFYNEKNTTNPAIGHADSQYFYGSR